MKLELCCVLSPYVTCQAREGIYCKHCWCMRTVSSSTHPDRDAEKYFGEKYLEPRLCKASNTKVVLTEDSEYGNYTFETEHE